MLQHDVRALYEIVATTFQKNRRDLALSKLNDEALFIERNAMHESLSALMFRNFFLGGGGNVKVDFWKSNPFSIKFLLVLILLKIRRSPCFSCFRERRRPKILAIKLLLQL